jgi:hypothetical protein
VVCDREIAQVPDFSVLIFSDYDSTSTTGLTCNILEEGTLYMRSRFKGFLDDVEFISEWSAIEVVSSGSDPSDPYTFFCLNANSASAEGAKDFREEVSFLDIVVFGNVNVKDYITKPYIYFDGSGDYLTICWIVFNFNNITFNI